MFYLLSEPEERGNLHRSQPGEAEEARARRAANEAQAHYNQHSSLLAGHIVPHMDREYVPKTSR